jgi:hypothetical protein
VEVLLGIEVQRQRELRFGLSIADPVGRPRSLQAQSLPEEKFDGQRAIGKLSRDRVVAFVGDAPLSPLQAELEIECVSRIQSPQIFGPIEGGSGQTEKQVEIHEAKRRFGRKQQDQGAKIPREFWKSGSVFALAGSLMGHPGRAIQEAEERRQGASR